TMPAILSGISNGAKRGLLFKGGLHLEHLSSIKVFAFDKTGTLTEGKPVVTDFIIGDGVNRDEALELIAAIESQSNHPLAIAITQYAKSEGLKQTRKVEIEDVPGWGIKAMAQGDEYIVGKPA